MEEQVNSNKEKNKRMLKVIAIEGGTAFTILFSFMLITALVKNSNDNKAKEAEAREQAEIKEKSQELYNSFKYIANEQYKQCFSTSSTNMFIDKITSFTPVSNGVMYCCLANDSILKIDMTVQYSDFDSLIKTVNNNYQNNSYFTITTEVMDKAENATLDNQVKQHFKPSQVEDIATTHMVSNLYKSVNPNETYTSLTYFNPNENKYVSYNDIVWKIDTSEFDITSSITYTFDANKDSNKQENKIIEGLYKHITQMY